jgi:hypothetical protein
LVGFCGSPSAHAWASVAANRSRASSEIAILRPKRACSSRMPLHPFVHQRQIVAVPTAFPFVVGTFLAVSEIVIQVIKRDSNHVQRVTTLP